MDSQALNRKILIVEDEAPLLEILVDRFTSEGFTVFGVSKGEEAQEVAIKEHPDLILMDILLPGITGLGVLKNLRDDPWGRDVPVIMLTNLSDSDKVSTALELGAYDFLVKADWKVDDLVKKVNDRLGGV